MTHKSCIIVTPQGQWPFGVSSLHNFYFFAREWTNGWSQGKDALCFCVWMCGRLK